MDVILLERIARLGELGDVVTVKAGYARNFLLPQKKALRATNENKEYFEREKTNIEKANDGKRSDAETTAAGLDGQKFVLIRQAGESGHLYGSVSARDIAGAASDKGFAVSRQQVAIDRPIKELGLHEAAIALHPELVVTVSINVALSEAEAEAQALRGVMVGEDEAEAAAAGAAEAFREEPEEETDETGEADTQDAPEAPKADEANEDATQAQAAGGDEPEAGEDAKA